MCRDRNQRRLTKRGDCERWARTCKIFVTIRCRSKSLPNATYAGISTASHLTRSFSFDASCRARYALLLDTYIRDREERDKLFNAYNDIPCVKRKGEWRFAAGVDRYGRDR